MTRLLARALVALAQGVLDHPRRVWWVMCVVGLVGCLLATLVPRDLSFGGVMDRNHPEVERYFQASKQHGLGRELPLLLEGPEAELDQLRTRVVKKLQVHPDVERVYDPPDAEWFLQRLPYLVDASTYTAWQALVAKPQSAAALRDLQDRLDTVDSSGLELAQPGSRLVLITLVQDSFHARLDNPVVPALQGVVDQEIAGTSSPGEFRGRFSGMPAIVYQDGEATLGALAWLSPVSLVLTLLILIRFERRRQALLGLALPMVLAAGTSIALVAFILGTLTIMEALFGVIVFGLGIDVAIHLRMRVREEQARGHGFAEAVRRTYRGTGPGVVVGALTTAGAFAMLATAPELSFRHLGLCGAVGVVLCLLWMLTMLPLGWRGAEQEHGNTSSPNATAPGQHLPHNRVVAAIARHATQRPLLHLGLAVVLLAGACVGLGRFTYETDLRALVNRELDAVSAGNDVQQRFGVTAGPWVAEVESLSQAQKIADTWVSSGLISQVESAAVVLPADMDRRREWFAQAAGSLGPALAQAGAEERFGDAFPLLQAVVGAAEMPVPKPGDLPEPLRVRWVTGDGKLRVFGYPATPHLDADQATRERRVVREVAPEATSMAVLFEVLIGTDRPWFPRVLGQVLVFVLLLLWLDFRRVGLCLLALLPVSVGALISVGVLCWAGVAFNTVTVMAVPLIVGLGVDDGVHVVHRLREQRMARADEAATAVGSAIWLTTATTSASFGALALSGHPGMESMGLVMLVALPVCLWTSISILPALAATGRFSS